jgi:hypothetical protein
VPYSIAEVTEMRAVPFGEDGCAGDSAFYPSEEEAIEVHHYPTFDELLTQWKEIDPDDEDRESPVGFWLLEDSDWDTVQLVDVECYSDSQTYTLNRTRKTMCSRLAKRVIEGND